MSLLSKLEAKGVRVYNSTPLYEEVSTIDTVTIGENCVVTHNSEFDTYSLAIEEGEQRVYIPLKSQVSPDKDSYVITEFKATRDWADKNISKGDTKVFAV